MLSQVIHLISFIDTQMPSAVKSGKRLHGKRKTVEGRAGLIPPLTSAMFFSAVRGYVRDQRKHDPFRGKKPF